MYINPDENFNSNSLTNNTKTTEDDEEDDSDCDYDYYLMTGRRRRNRRHHHHHNHHHHHHGSSSKRSGRLISSLNQIKPVLSGNNYEDPQLDQQYGDYEDYEDEDTEDTEDTENTEDDLNVYSQYRGRTTSGKVASGLGHNKNQRSSSQHQYILKANNCNAVSCNQYRNRYNNQYPVCKNLLFV